MIGRVEVTPRMLTLTRPDLACRTAWKIALVTAYFVGHPAARADDSEGLRIFREAIEPVLVKQCYRCHSGQAEKLKAGLRLDSREAMLRGGDTGPAVVPGKSGESLLVQAIRHEDGLEMPPKAPALAEEVVARFVKWIDAGAPTTADGSATAVVASGPGDARKHWAFQPIGRPEPPAVNDPSWALTPVDVFVFAKLEGRGWSPAPDASRSDWLRRVTFDLTGLPPSPEDVEAFERDTSPNAFESVADRLLASPHYGERWAQHWLDVIRYAETEGFEYDRHIPDAWRFRDYVIGSLNRDKPFNRFVTEQIAGDEIAPADREVMTASAFHRLGPVRRNAGNPDIALSRNEVLTERTDIVGTAFLGLTIGCARCHNHKLEPISQKDYYRFQAYLAATDESNVALVPVKERTAWEAETKSVNDRMEQVRARMKRVQGPDRERLVKQLQALEDQLPPSLPTIPATRNDLEHRTLIHVLKRGEWEAKGEPVGPRPPSVLVGDLEPELSADIVNPRTRLAAWLTGPSQPLTARVFVNRVWQHHFGAGLVKTVNDFGLKGDRPSHPELLDWLASEFISGGWRSKPLHRLIVLSHAYRQSDRAESSAEPLTADPDNRLLWHFARRRLTAEEIRDAMLMASGRLQNKAGGPRVMVPVDPDMTRLLYKPSQWKAATDAAERDRRSIYLFAKRNLRPPFLEVFDSPALMTSCARRESSTHAPQALELLNGWLSNDLASSFARRLEAESGGDPLKVVSRAFSLALGRPPTDRERALALEFVRDQPLTEFALAVFNLNGFLYVR
jgi:hypothetical protein